MSSPPDDYSKFVNPRADEELHQHAPIPVTMGTDPKDGLPTQIAPRNFDKAPPLTEETLVCMADKRSFVIRREDGSIAESFAPSVVNRLPNGCYYVEDSQLSTGRAWTSESMSAYSDDGKRRGVHEVEPLRPECEHYIRSQTDIAADRDRRFLMRACAVQRDESGEYHSIRDSLIAACSLRSPRHYETESLLDAFDDGKIQQAKERADQEAFSIDDELEKESQGNKLGILG